MRRPSAASLKNSKRLPFTSIVGSVVTSARSRTTLILVAIALLGWILVGHLRDRLARHPRYLVDPAQVALDAIPEWLPEPVREAFAAFRPFDEPRSIFDRKLLGDVRDAYLGFTWVSRVLDVRRQFPNRLRIELQLRSPFAVVEHAQGRAVIDETGFRLPDTVMAEAERRPVLKVGKLKGVPPVGRTFEQPAVLHALSVLADLQPFAVDGRILGLKVDKIDATNALGVRDPKESEILLVTDGGVDIEWGRSRLSPYACLELPAADKIENLRRTLEEKPDLRDLVLVQVRFKDPGYRAAPLPDEK